MVVVYIYVYVCVCVCIFFFPPSKKLASEVNKGFGAKQIWVQVQPLTDTCRVCLGKLTNLFDFFIFLSVS